ncbi:MAG: redoxin domain-containing protein [Myxococcota bacterium]
MKTQRVLFSLLLAGLLAVGVGCQKDASQEKDEQAEAVESDKAAEGEKKEGGVSAEADKKAEEAGEADEKEQAAETATVGEAAPDFTLTDTTGEEHSLSDFEGKTVVLEWTSQSCPYVVRHYEAETMAKTYEAVGKDDVVWLTIDSTHDRPAEELKTWKEKEGFDYPVLADKDGKVGKMYNAKTTPHMYVIGPKGVLQYAGAIDNDPRGEKADGEVVNYVEQAVTAVKAGETPEKAETKPYGCSVKYNKS